jgi:hypothetical protein
MSPRVGVTAPRPCRLHGMPRHAPASLYAAVLRSVRLALRMVRLPECAGMNGRTTPAADRLGCAGATEPPCRKQGRAGAVGGVGRATMLLGSSPACALRRLRRRQGAGADPPHAVRLAAARAAAGRARETRLGVHGLIRPYEGERHAATGTSTGRSRREQYHPAARLERRQIVRGENRIIPPTIRWLRPGTATAPPRNAERHHPVRPAPGGRWAMNGDPPAPVHAARGRAGAREAGVAPPHHLIPIEQFDPAVVRRHRDPPH